MDGEECKAPRIVHCARCLTPCEVRGPSPRLNYSQVVLVATESDRGMCACCAVHWWLFSVDALRWALEKTPQMLRQPAVQARFVPLLKQMHEELGAVDWGRMLAQWDAPWPDDWSLPDGRHAV